VSSNKDNDEVGTVSDESVDVDDDGSIRSMDEYNDCSVRDPNCLVVAVVVGAVVVNRLEFRGANDVATRDWLMDGIHHDCTCCTITNRTNNMNVVFKIIILRCITKSRLERENRFNAMRDNMTLIEAAEEEAGRHKSIMFRKDRDCFVRILLSSLLLSWTDDDDGDDNRIGSSLLLLLLLLGPISRLLLLKIIMVFLDG
jgi:hypothetical protein